jgi:tripartite-type tricarboxylate transporter receptor subunit TctC
MTIYIGFSAIGGIGYDTYGRVMARHMGKHIPGNPSISPANKPGAGSMTLANYLYNAAPKDGTEIALLARGVAMDKLINGDAATAKFDATKFNWLGSMNNEVAGFFISGTAPARDLKEILAGKELTVGSSGAGSDAQIFGAVLNAVLGTNLKIIAGYPGMSEVLLAIERGELDGVPGYSWGSARTGSAQNLKDGSLKLVMQLALTKHPDLPNVPLVTDLVESEGDKQVLELVFARQSMGRPFAAPPGLAPQMAATLRKAFTDAMHDPQLVAECEKIGMEISYVSGAEIQALVEKLHTFPKEVTSRAQKIAGAK